MRQPVKTTTATTTATSSTSQLGSAHNSLMQLTTSTQYMNGQCVIDCRYESLNDVESANNHANKMLFYRKNIAFCMLGASKSSYHTVDYIFFYIQTLRSLFYYFLPFDWVKWNIWKWICHFRRSRYMRSFKKQHVFRPALECSEENKKMQKPQFHCVVSFYLFSILLI